MKALSLKLKHAKKKASLLYQTDQFLSSPWTTTSMFCILSVLAGLSKNRLCHSPRLAFPATSLVASPTIPYLVTTLVSFYPVKNCFTSLSRTTLISYLTPFNPYKIEENLSSSLLSISSTRRQPRKTERCVLIKTHMHLSCQIHLFLC